MKITPRIRAIKVDPECFGLCVDFYALFCLNPVALYLCVVGCAVACEAE